MNPDIKTAEDLQRHIDEEKERARVMLVEIGEACSWSLVRHYAYPVIDELIAALREEIFSRDARIAELEAENKRHLTHVKGLTHELQMTAKEL